MQNTFEELCKSNETIKATVKELRDQVAQITEEIKVCDQMIKLEYFPEIEKMRIKLQDELVKQKTENFIFVKEIAILEKEKLDLQNAIYIGLGKLHKLEREVGVKSKAYTYMCDQSIIDNEIGNKFVIEKEEI